MKRCFFTLAAACLMLSGSISAQDTVPLESVKDMYKEAALVARVNVQDTQPTGKGDGYYYGFIASGRVDQPFKGNVKRGQSLKFYVRAEYGYDHKQMRGDQIVFLTSFVDRKKGPFEVLPDGNSTFAYSDVLAADVRKVQFSSSPHRTRSKRK